MWASGRHASHRSDPGRTPIASLVAWAEAATAACVSTTPFGRPVVPLVATTSASPGSTGRPPDSDRRSPVGLDDGSRCHGLDHQLPFGVREAGIDREGGITVGPHALERSDELRSTRQVEGDEFGHGGSVDGRPVGPGLRSAP